MKAIFSAVVTRLPFLKSAKLWLALAAAGAAVGLWLYIGALRADIRAAESATAAAQSRYETMTQNRNELVREIARQNAAIEKLKADAAAASAAAAGRAGAVLGAAEKAQRVDDADPRSGPGRMNLFLVEEFSR